MKAAFGVLVFSTCLSNVAMAAPAIWQVSDADSAVWLFGSVHMLPAQTPWRTRVLDKLVSKADRIYFEADVGPAAQAAMLPLSMELGFNHNGTLLSDQIGSTLTDRVRVAAQTYDIPMPALLTMKPWLAATTLATGPLAQSGYDAALGVEMVLAGELADARKGYLETGAEQLAFLAGGSLEEQIAMLEATLDTLDMAQADLKTMIDAWLAGEPEQLGVAFDAQMAGFDADTAERLIDERNHNWIEQIDAMLARNEQALIVVGAAHLAGEVSVVRLLEERGFSSTRVQ